MAVVTTLLGLLFAHLRDGPPAAGRPGARGDRGRRSAGTIYERVYNELGLDRPVWEQFGSYIGKRR